MGEFGIGQSVPREEDPYLLRGAGRYVDDVIPQGQLRAYVLRSPHGHAKLRAIDAEAARAAPGVQLVLTGRDEAVRALGYDVAPSFCDPDVGAARRAAAGSDGSRAYADVETCLRTG